MLVQKDFISSLVAAYSFLVLIWAVHLAGGVGLIPGGILPKAGNVPFGIATAPILHGGREHLVGNSTYLLILLFALALVTNMPIVVIGLIAILSGLFTWQFGSPGVHIGASGVMYGLVPYLIFIGLRKGGVFIALAVVIAVLMGFSTLMSILPVPQVSWEMHLGGILAGTALGLIMPADQ